MDLAKSTTRTTPSGTHVPVHRDGRGRDARLAVLLAGRQRRGVPAGAPRGARASVSSRATAPRRALVERPQRRCPPARARQRHGLPAHGPDGHDDDTSLQYEPTVAPIVAGGYAWVVFTSRRLYGNVATRQSLLQRPALPRPHRQPDARRSCGSPPSTCRPPGTDPSHPAFYLPAQELLAGNSRGFWVLACKRTAPRARPATSAAAASAVPTARGRRCAATSYRPTAARWSTKAARPWRLLRAPRDPPLVHRRTLRADRHLLSGVGSVPIGSLSRFGGTPRGRPFPARKGTRRRRTNQRVGGIRGELPASVRCSCSRAWMRFAPRPMAATQRRRLCRRERRRRPAPTIPCFPAMWRISRSRSRFAVATRALSPGTRGTSVTGSCGGGICVSRIEQATPLVEWDEIQPLADGVFPAGAEGSFGLTPEPIRCNSPGPYLVSATVGPYFARRGHLSADDIACFRGRHEGDAAGDRADRRRVGFALRICSFRRVSP